MCVYAYVSVGDVLAIKITGSGYVKLYFFKIRIKGDTHTHMRMHTECLAHSHNSIN